MVAPNLNVLGRISSFAVNQRTSAKKSFQFVSISREQNYQLVAKRGQPGPFLDTVNPGEA
jgi:hypothetical protein